MPPYRAIIVDDHPPIRALVRMLLELDGVAEVIGEAESGEAAIRLAREPHPDVLVLDAVLPDLDGAAVVRAVRATAPATRIFVYTGYANLGLAATFFRLGVDGYLLKAASLAELTLAVRQVRRGDRYVDPRIAGQLLGGQPTRRWAGLSARENEVLELVAAGCRDQIIADRLGISLHTVHYHVRQLFAKLDATNRTELAARAHGRDGASASESKRSGQSCRSIALIAIDRQY